MELMPGVSISEYLQRRKSRFYTRRGRTEKRYCRSVIFRRELRRGRRTRKTRYRQPRFQNRKKKDGWLAPSIRQKVGTHMAVVEKVCKICRSVKLSWKPHRLIFKRSKIRRFMVWNTNREISLVLECTGACPMSRSSYMPVLP